MSVIEVNGTTLYYEVAGEGPTLVLNHAGIADSRMWDDQIGALAQHYTVIRWDLRGHGQSPMPPASYSDHEDLYELLRRLGVRHALLVGASKGGRAALDFTLRHPGMVGALALAAPTVSGFQIPPHPRLEEIDAAIGLGDITRAVELELRLWADGPAGPAGRVPSGVRERIRTMNTDTYAMQSGEASHVPLRPPAIDRLSQIHCPTLVVVGDRDVPHFLAVAELLEKEIPHVRKVIMPNTAHMLSMERPDEFNRLLLDFFDALQST